MELVRGLDALHAGAASSAQLMNFSTEASLAFEIVNPNRAQIAITGRFPYNAPEPDNLSLQFDGLLIDQSFLPSISLAVSRFLADARPDTTSPWDRQ